MRLLFIAILILYIPTEVSGQNARDAYGRRLFDDCLADKFFDGFTGNALLDRDSPPKILSKNTFDGKTVIQCRWISKYTTIFSSCINNLKARYKEMVSVFPETKSSRFEEAIEIPSTMQSKLYIEITYKVDGNSVVFTDVVSGLKDNKFPTLQDKINEIDETFKKLLAVNQNFCNLNKLSDSSLREEFVKLKQR